MTCILSTTTIIGNKVCNPKGENLGKVEEVMIDCVSGHIAYAVLSFGGFLGFGDKLFAIPWRRLEVDTENKRCVLDVDKETLKDAPGFTKNSWPKWDMTYADSVYSYHKTEPYWVTV